MAEARINELPEDLLVKILELVPTKLAVSTMFVSKRWLYTWTMLSTLEYKDIDNDEKSVWWFLDGSLQLNKAPVIDRLCIELGPQCPTDVDAGKWVAKAVDQRVRVLDFQLKWSAGPIILPKRLYNSETLRELILWDKIVVDFPSSCCLPSLEYLQLQDVVYKDEDSVFRFLSSCPVLEYLIVSRKKYDNVKKFIVKVPVLRVFLYSCFTYYYGVGDNTGRCLVMDTPALHDFSIIDASGDNFSIHNMPCLDTASFRVTFCSNDKLFRSLSSVSSFELLLNKQMLMYCSAINFPLLIKLTILPQKTDWLKPLMLLLGNAPKLKHLMVDYRYRDQSKYVPLSWNQPSSVPGCLSSQLEIFGYRGYGDRDEEEEFLTYILTNSKCLKTTTISISETIDFEEQELIIEELEDIPRACQLLFIENSTKS